MRISAMIETGVNAPRNHYSRATDVAEDEKSLGMQCERRGGKKESEGKERDKHRSLLSIVNAENCHRDIPPQWGRRERKWWNRLIERAEIQR